MESGFKQEANKLRGELAESLMGDVDAAMEAKDLESAISLRDLAKEIQNSNPKLGPTPPPAPIAAERLQSTFPSGAILHFTFETETIQKAKSGATRVLDVSGNSNHGMADSVVTLENEGSRGKAVFLDRSTPPLVLSTKIIPRNGDFGVFLWMNSGQMEGQGHLFSNNSAQKERANLHLSEGMLTWFHSSVGEVTTAKKVADNAWHHVGVTRRGQLFEIWADGKVVARCTTNEPLSDDVRWQFGRAVATPHPQGHIFVGGIDEVVVFDRALDASEVKRIMKGG